MNHRHFSIGVALTGLVSLLALLLTGCAPASAPVAVPAAAPAANTGLSTLHFFYTDW